jgi:glucosamine kinase
MGPDMLPHLHAGAGLAGFVLPRDRKAALDHPHPFASLTLDTDAYIAFLGAHGGEDGAILVLGTGSCGLALVGGRRDNVGGWGVPVSDQGSGASIGREAVRMSLWAHENVLRPTDLSREVITRLGGTPEDVVVWADAAEPHDYAVFCQLVFEYETRGDAIARAIVVRAVDHVGKMVSALVALGAPKVVLVGGVAAPITPHLAPETRACLALARGDPLDGAVLMARREGAS